MTARSRSKPKRRWRPSRRMREPLTNRSARRSGASNTPTPSVICRGSRAPLRPSRTRRSIAVISSRPRTWRTSSSVPSRGSGTSTARPARCARAGACFSASVASRRRKPLLSVRSRWPIRSRKVSSRPTRLRRSLCSVGSRSNAASSPRRPRPSRRRVLSRSGRRRGRTSQPASQRSSRGSPCCRERSTMRSSTPPPRTARRRDTSAAAAGRASPRRSSRSHARPGISPSPTPGAPRGSSMRSASDCRLRPPRFARPRRACSRLAATLSARAAGGPLGVVAFAAYLAAGATITVGWEALYERAIQGSDFYFIAVSAGQLALWQLLSAVAVIAGSLAGPRFARAERGTNAFLEAAGAYSLASLLLVFVGGPIDPRLAPYNVFGPPAAHVALVAAQAIVAGVVLAWRGRGPLRPLALAGGFALVGLRRVVPKHFTTPVGAIRFNWTEYWPRSLMLVPPATALAVAAVAALARRRGIHAATA